MSLRDWRNRRHRRKLRVVLFIGHHKVGSTALQSHMARHAPAALRRRLLYPVVTAADLATLNARVAAGDAQQPLSRNVTEAHNALAFSLIHDFNPAAPIPGFHQNLPPSSEMFALIRQQIARHRPRVLVLASEVFANFAAISPELIRNLVAGLGLHPQGARIELFAALRRVDDYLAAWHSQRVHLGQQTRPLPLALDHYRNTVHFDYRLMLEGWQRALPEARLVLRPYDDGMRVTGMPQSFAGAMGLDLPGLDAPPEIVNPGLHRGLLDIARRAVPDLGPDEAQGLFRTLLALGPKLDLPPSQDVELFGATARSEMAEGFAPIHDWLSAMIGQPFFADAAEIGTMRPMDEFEVNTKALAQIRAGHLDAFTDPARRYLEDFKLQRNFAGGDGAQSEGNQ